MSIIVNDRDVLLQAATPRFDTTGKGILLSSSSSTIRIATDGTPTPATVTFTAMQLGAPGGVVWTVVGGALTGTGNTRTLDAASVTGDTVTVTASVLYAGVNYQSSCTVQRVRDGAAGTAGTAGPRGAGNYYATGSAWSDATADAATPGSNLVDDTVTISNGTNFVMVKKWSGTAWVAQGTVLDGSLLVTGSVTAAAINSNNLTIRDAVGNIILGAGTNLDWTKIAGTGKPVDNATRNTGAFADISTITAANIASFFGTDAISGTYISNLVADKVYGGTLGGASISIGSSAGGTVFSVVNNGTVVSYRQLSGYNIDASFLASPGTPSIKGTGFGAEGVFGYNSSGNTGGHGVRGQAATTGNTSSFSSGIVGAANGYDFYADGAGVNYGPFTGAHDAIWPNGETIELGDIVVDVACVARGGLSNTLFRVAPSSIPCQQAAVGVLASLVGPLSESVPAVFIRRSSAVTDEGPSTSAVVVTTIAPEYEALKDAHHLGSVNALGEGQINVCGEGGDIAAGDLIVTSSMRGKGMRQVDDVVRGYTVAKAREAVSFTSPSEVGQIACFYIAG